MNLFRCAIIGFLLLQQVLLSGQDPRFSQFYAAPIITNPALNGVFDGEYRVSLNYRALYPTLLSDRPFRTYSAGYETRFRTVHSDFLGVGLAAQRDEAGIARYNRTQAHVGLSYLKQLSGSRYAASDQYLVAGIQAGMGQHALAFEKLWFSSQFDRQNVSVDPNLPSGENLPDQTSNLLLDINIGLLWWAVFDDNLSLYAGGAMHHVNQPLITFLEAEDSRLDRRWTGQFGGEIPITDELSTLPALLVMSQGPSFSTTAGANLRYTNHEWKELALRAGLFVHLANELDSGLKPEAFVFTAIFELERWNLGFSYDVTASPLRRSNYSRGAFEVSLIYSRPTQSRYKVQCPKY